MPKELVSMQLTKAERKADSAPCAMGDEGDKFPYGIALHLDDVILDKLGISDLPDIGATDTLQASVKVTSVSESASERSEQRRSVTLQITALQLGDSDSSPLYGSKKA